MLWAKNWIDCNKTEAEPKLLSLKSIFLFHTSLSDTAEWTWPQWSSGRNIEWGTARPWRNVRGSDYNPWFVASTVGMSASVRCEVEWVFAILKLLNLHHQINNRDFTKKCNNLHYRIKDKSCRETWFQIYGWTKLNKSSGFKFAFAMTALCLLKVVF